MFEELPRRGRRDVGAYVAAALATCGRRTAPWRAALECGRGGVPGYALRYCARVLPARLSRSAASTRARSAALNSTGRVVASGAAAMTLGAVWSGIIAYNSVVVLGDALGASQISVGKAGTRKVQPEDRSAPVSSTTRYARRQRVHAQRIRGNTGTLRPPAVDAGGKGNGSVAWAKVTGSQRRCLRNRPRRTFAYDTDADYPSGSLRAYSRPHRRSSRKRNAKLTYSKTVNAYAGICRGLAGRWSRRPHVAPERWSTSPRLPNPRRKQGRSPW